MFLVTERLFSV